MKKILISVLLIMSAVLPVVADDVTYLTTEEFKARIFDYTTEKE